MNDALEMNVAGRLMLVLSHLQIKDARRLAIYTSAVSDVVRAQMRKDPAFNCGNMSPFLEQQLASLEDALRARARQPDAVSVPAAEATADRATDKAAKEPQTEVPAKRHKLRSSEYAPPAKSMEEKLKEEREPIQKLILDDCVALGLVKATQAKDLVAGMTGKTSQAAESEIAGVLRQQLHDQVKRFIRKSKGGPWSDPHAQEDLRQDIHMASNVRSVLMLCRQIVKEQKHWEAEHGRGGLLGLFGAKRRHSG